MARKVTLTSGSILAGNPITFCIQPNVLPNTPSFHRVIVEVKCGISGGNFETIKLTAPVAIEGNDVEIDVSSAIRVPLDSYEYSPDAATYPLCKWQLRVYDEYMDSGGAVHSQQGEMYFPDKNNYYCCIAGAFSDYERLASNGSKDVTKLSRKPTSSPQIVAVGETFAYTPPFEKQALLVNSASLVAPTSVVTTIDKKGLQTIGDQKVYALPAEEVKTRQVFRFINSFGVLESVSVPKVYSSKVSVSSTSYAISRQETFNKFSRSTVRKANNRESWLYLTDPLTLNWLEWYMHEFLMAEHIWMYVKGTWLPCTITPENDTTLFDHTQQNPYTIAFSVQLDINGSPLI